MQSGQQQWTVDKVSNTFKNCISMMSPDGSIILVRDYDKNSILRAHDMKTGQQQWTVDKVSAEYKPLMSPGASTILVRDYDKNSILRAFDMKTGQQQWTVDKVSDFKSKWCGNWHTWSTISPDGSTILVRFSDYDKNSTLSLITHSPCIL